MVFLWSSTFFCLLLPSLLPWVHLAEEERIRTSNDNLSLSEVPPEVLLFLSQKLFDQEAESKETEQLNPDVVKKEITANWSQPRLQKVLLRLRLFVHCTQSLYQHIKLTRYGRGWLRDLKGVSRK